MLALLGAGALAMTAAAPAGAATTLTVKGGPKMKPGHFIMDTMRFAPLTRGVKSGSELTIRNKTGQPHTLSIVPRSVLPKNASQMDKFFESDTMGEFMQAHGVDPNNEDAPPQNPLVDVGQTGFDQAGDSVFFAGPSQKIDVTADKGETLNFICLIHPWMQGRLKAT
jgi:hypothetical protein